MVRILQIPKKKVSRVFKAQCGWRVVGGKKIYFRSKWEWQYAVYLEFTKQREIISDWLYEPQTFWFEKIKRGVTSYKPDFKIIEKDGKHRWAEVKGFMDSKSITKIKRFAKYYPEENLEVIDHTWFISNHCMVDTLIKISKIAEETENEQFKENGNKWKQTERSEK